MPWLAILNPASGALGGRRRADQVVARLTNELGIPVVVTTAPGDAEAVARNASGYDGLLAVGGDGTVAEVVNGMDHRRQTLALIPTGTGNGLARDLGLSLVTRRSGTSALAAALDAEVTALIDLIEVTFQSHGQWVTRLAVGTTGVGYAAEVVALARGRLAPLNRHLPAGFCYPLGATLQTLRQRAINLRIGLDDQPLTWRRATNLMVNSTAHAGNFRAFPRSRPDDGRLTVLVACATPLAQLRHNLAVLRKTYGFRTAEEAPAQYVRMQSDRPLLLMLDGELFAGVTEARWRVVPRVLRLAAPNLDLGRARSPAGAAALARAEQ